MTWILRIGFSIAMLVAFVVSQALVPRETTEYEWTWFLLFGGTLSLTLFLVSAIAYTQPFKFRHHWKQSVWWSVVTSTVFTGLGIVLIQMLHVPWQAYAISVAGLFFLLSIVYGVAYVFFSSIYFNGHSIKLER